LSSVLLVLVFVVGAAQSSNACNKLQMTPFDGAFREGVVDGKWVGVVLNYTGTNGFAADATAFSVGPGGNGPQLMRAGTIKALGADGDRLDFYFINDKLYSVNDIYGPGVPHCCPTQAGVARYGFHREKLVREGSATVRNPAQKYNKSDESAMNRGCVPPTLRNAILKTRLVGPYM
jgi:hypothetical protein